MEGLSRTFFVVGHAALQQLVHAEGLATAIRRQRTDAEKAKAEARSDRLHAGLTQGVTRHDPLPIHPSTWMVLHALLCMDVHGCGSSHFKPNQRVQGGGEEEDEPDYLGHL